MRRPTPRFALLLPAFLLTLGCSVMVDPDGIKPEATTGGGTGGAPTVQSTTPADLAAGAPIAAPISVTFSAAMDPATTQPAFSILSPAGHDVGTFSWSTDGRTMSFVPSVAFAHGDAVSCRVSTVAKNLAGTPLAADFDFSFNVIRKGTVTLYSIAAFDGMVWSSGYAYSDLAWLYAGDNTENGHGRAFVSFALSQLPASATVTAATLGLYQQPATGTPYETLGSLLAERVAYGPSLDAGDLTLPARDSTSYVLSNSAAEGWKTVDVTPSVSAAWSDRAVLSDLVQFRMRFIQNSNANFLDDFASLASGDALVNKPYLLVTYEYP